MRKRLLSLCLVVMCLLVVFAFASCGENDEKTEESNGPCQHVEEIIPAVEPTCTESGLTEGKKCSECGKKIVRQKTVRAKGHECENGRCIRCNERISEGLEYVLNNDKMSYSVASIGSCAETQIYISSVYGGLPVTKIGFGAFKNCYDITSVTIPDSITILGKLAFQNCVGLTEINFNATKMDDLSLSDKIFSGAGEDGDGITVNIGKNVTKIPSNLFYTPRYDLSPAPKITSVVFEEGSICNTVGDYAFQGCKSLTSIAIPDGVTRIGSYAFGDCDNLTNVTMGNSVTSIGDYAFENCASLTNAVVPNGVERIGSYAFCGCESLTSITIPHSVTILDTWAFRDCANLTIYCEVTSKPSEWHSNWNSSECPVIWDCNNNDVADDGYIYTVIDGIRYAIRYGAATVVEQPSNIEEANILSSITYKETEYKVTSICNYAFKDCTSLTSITIPDSVAEISDYAFKDCTSLTIYCEAESEPSGWDSEWNYSGCPVVWDCNNNDVATNGYIYTVIDGIRYVIKYEVATVAKQPKNIKEANIPSKITYKGTGYKVKSIGDSAFEKCYSLESVSISDRVTSIGNYAFQGCSSLTSITISNSVTIIRECAFNGCTSLTSITIPDRVSSIGEKVFYGCDSLTIYCEAESKPGGWSSSWNYSDCPVVWGYTEK